MSPERKLEAYLVKRCKQLDLMTRKVQWIGRNGAPDRVIFGRWGEIVWVELKSLQGKLSVLQEQEIRRLHARYQLVEVVRTIEELENVLVHFRAPRLPDPDNSSDPDT
jgi:hypothetical protein